MNSLRYRALQTSGEGDIQSDCSVVKLDLNPKIIETHVIVRVQYASLNYKDALSASGHKGVTHQFPHVPGIDAAGVIESLPIKGDAEQTPHQNSRSFSVGDAVMVTGFDLGMNTDGGFGELIAVPPHWIVKLPESLNLLDTMMLGTAGMTAGMAVDSLLQVGVTPNFGDIAVTGATGGVGSIAIMLLKKLGYAAVAITGKTDETDYLQRLGASEVITRAHFLADADKPLLPERWGGAIDTVGGQPLMTVLKGVRYGGSVACCGMAASPFFEANVYPFILRGVNLLGVDSAHLPLDIREEIWDHFGTSWRLPDLKDIVEVVGLSQLPEKMQAMLAGTHKGRVVLDMALK